MSRLTNASFNLNRQIMEIKPSWLLEGTLYQSNIIPEVVIDLSLSRAVAPHFFKPADIEEMMASEKKMPKAIGAASTGSGANSARPRP